MAALAALAVTLPATAAAAADRPRAGAGVQTGGHSHRGDAAHAGHQHGKDIATARGNARPAAFDLVNTSVRRLGNRLVFTEQVSGAAGSVRPGRTGKFAGSEVLSYVWPVSLDPSSVGFTSGSGVLALAATSHPDFDDTPRYDENHNGRADDDGGRWHTHWVVLVPDTTRGDGALKVRDIAAGEQPDLPDTWPGVPLYLDSPAYPTVLLGHTVLVTVPLADVGFPATFRYDGVTAALRINADLHDPLLRVENVFDVASDGLSLPGVFG